MQYRAYHPIWMSPLPRMATPVDAIHPLDIIKQAAQRPGPRSWDGLRRPGPWSGLGAVSKTKEWLSVGRYGDVGRGESSTNAATMQLS